MSESGSRLTKEELGRRLQELSFEPRSLQISEENWRYRERVAVRVVYSLRELQPPHVEATPGEQAAIQKVLKESTLRFEGSQPVWQLGHDVRRATLYRLAAEDRLVEALDANPASQSSTVQEMLELYIRGQAPLPSKQSLEQLEATLQVVSWLGGCMPHVPSEEEIRRHMKRERLLSPFRFLAGSHFRNRDYELQELRDYLGHAPFLFSVTSVHQDYLEAGELASEFRQEFEDHGISLSEKITIQKQAEGGPWRIAEIDTGQTFMVSREGGELRVFYPPLMIYGPGGIGKSSLIAQFILEHAELEADWHLPYTYIDFNRRDVDIQEPASLLLEATRQIGIQYPNEEERWTRLAESLRQRIEEHALSEVQRSGRRADLRVHAYISARRREWNRYFRDFVKAVASLPGPDQPFLLVLDTVEELLYHNIEYLDDLWFFLDYFRERLPALRTLLSGRSPLPDSYPTRNILLDGLDAESAVEVLLGSGIPNETVATQIIEVVGRSPFSLWLATDLYRRMKEEDVDLFQDIAQRQEYFYQVKEYLLQGQLYRRILGHIHATDPRVKSLAHPGMVLRRVTPELILNVLSEACDVEVKDLNDAQELFAKLKDEVAIVEINQVNPSELRQRPELRLAMLELLRQDDDETVTRVHQQAAAYFRRQVEAKSPPDVQDLADEAYHRLALGENPAFLDGYETGELQRIADELGSVIQDLPPNAQTYLVSRAKVDIRLDPDVWEKADLASWELMTVRSVENLLNLGRYDDTLRKLDERSERTAGSPLYPLHVLALVGLNRNDEATNALEKGIRLTPPYSRVQQDLQSLAASLAEEKQQFEAALGYYRRALEIAERLRDDISMTVQLSILRLMRSQLPYDAPEIKDAFESLLGAWGAVSDEELIQTPTLIREIATQVGADSEAVVKRAVRLVGLGNSKPANLGSLASAAASWDDLRSADLDEEPGVLARSVKAEWRGDLYQTWLGFLKENPWDKTARSLERLVEDHPLTPTMSITLVELIKARLLLTARQASLLQAVLVDSFSAEELNRLLTEQFGITLTQVSHAEDYSDQAEDLVSWAESNVQTLSLLEALVIERPHHPELVDLLESLGIDYHPLLTLSDPEQAIPYYQSSLEEARQSEDRRAEADALAKLGNAYLDRAQGDRAENLERAIDHLSQSLEIYSREEPGREWAAATNNLGSAYLNRLQGDREENLAKAVECFESALHVYSREAYPAYWATVQGNLGQAYLHSGRIEQAIAHYQQALAISREIGDRRGEGADLGNLGSAYADLGQMEQAIEYYQQALAISREIGHPQGESTNLGNLGLAHASLGQMERAIEYYQQALAIAPEIGDRRSEAGTLANLGIAYRDVGQVDAAIDYDRRALAVARELGNRRVEGNVLSQLSLIYTDLDQTSKAIEYNEQALDIARSMVNRRMEANVLGNLGLAYARQGEITRAIELHQQNLALAQEIGDRRGEGNAHGNLGLAYAELGQSDDAVEHFNKQLAIMLDIGDVRGQEKARGNLGDTYFRIGDWGAALEHYGRALEAAMNLNDRIGIADNHFFLGLCFMEMGMPTKARGHLELALGTYEELEHPKAEQARDYLQEAVDLEMSGQVTGIATGGGAYISGAASSSVGDVVGRDKVEGVIGKGAKISENIADDQSQMSSQVSLALAVCRGEIVGVRETGSYFVAFLVSPDQVLTVYHTLKAVLDGGLPAQNLTFRFDLVTTATSTILSQGQAYALAVGREAEKRFDSQRPWLVAADETLDYALLRLARPAGEEVSRGLRAGRARGWLTLAEEAYLSSGDPLGTILLRHGAQLDALYEENAFVENIGYQFIHRLDTVPGASGAPIFNIRQEVVGLHQGSQPEEADGPRNIAVFVPSVVADLKRKNLWSVS